MTIYSLCCERCKKIGIKVFSKHDKKNLKEATIVVRSSAITENNLEIREAKKRKIPIYSRAEVLANVVSLKKILSLLVPMEKLQQHL